MPTIPSQPGSTAVDRIDAATSSVHEAGEEVAEVLADAHAEQAVERREHHLDRASRRVALGALGGDVAAGQLRHRERPAHESERLDQRPPPHRRRRTSTVSAGGAARTTASNAASGSIASALTSSASQRRMSPEPPASNRRQDLVRLLAQDVRVVERPAELEEGQVERDRDGDQQDRGGDLSAHALPAPVGYEPSRGRRRSPRSARSRA